MPAERRLLWVGIFLGPSLALLTAFSLLPIASSLVLTLYDWDLLNPPRFAGLGNFRRLARDTELWAALGHTLGFIGGYVPLALASGLGAALLLNQKLRGRSVYRAAIFLPVISAWVAVAVIWRWIYNPQFGLLNYLLSLVHIDGPAWLYETRWAMPAIILTSAWKDTGFLMILFLAGLQAIPIEYYEAAEMDGANAWQKFWRVTLPLLSPTTFFALIISLIHSFQVFDQVWIMTEGGPAGATTVLVERIVRNAFSYGRMGYAAAISWVLFALVFAITLLQVRLQGRWVHHD